MPRLCWCTRRAASGVKMGCVAAGDAQTLDDVLGGLVGGERLGAAPEEDALAELAHAGMTQLLFELRLTGEHDLQQLLGGGLEVGEQANLFEQLPGEVLRLVDDDDAGLIHAEALDEPAVELEQHAALGA